MLRELGYLFLIFSLVTSLYGSCSGFLAQITKKRLFLFSSRVASLYGTFFVLLASFVLIYSFLNSDYSILYVYKNSSSDLPFFYRVSAFWSSLEGSHLLWTLLLSLCTSLALWTFSKQNEIFLPLISFLLQGILAWMFFLAISSSSPFEPAFPVAIQGLGMNELLQNPYMMIHPPCLFLGYTSLAVPFAYSFSSIWMGELSREMLKSMRRWSLVSWLFLTIGVFLGGRWAYVELGWAGYWAWDPVENSSFIPWLFVTAFLHVLLLVRQHGKLAKLLFVFSFFSFFFCFFGTFITRSGMISSVHSFAQSDVAMSYLVFLIGLFVVFLVTYSFRGNKELELEKTSLPRFYQIDFLILCVLLCVSFVVIILMGTLYPIVSEYFTGIRFSVQSPYFNSFAPYIGFSFILLVTLGNLSKRRSYPKVFSKKNFLALQFLTAVSVFLFCFFGNIFETKSFYLFILQLVGVILCFGSFFLLVFDFFKKYKFSKLSFLSFFRINLGSFGALLAHLGILSAILGFLGNYRGLSQVKTLERFDTFSFYGYEFEFKGLELNPQDNTLLYQAVTGVKKDDKLFATLYPSRAKYPTKEDLIHEVDYSSTFWHDIYLTLVNFDQKNGEWVTIEFHINPTVRLVWGSLLFFIFGAFFSLLGLRKVSR